MLIKKLFFIFTLVLSLSSNDSFISLKYGLTSLDNDGGIDLNNNSFELDLTLDNGYNIMPRFNIGYIDIDEKGESVSGLLQLNVDGVYPFYINSQLLPYAFGGAGYENVMNSRKGFDSQFFLDGGVGVSYPISSSLKLLTELKGLYMIGGNDQDNEIAWYFGLGMPIGETSYNGYSQKDSDGDGVIDRDDSCSNTPYGTVVGADGCPMQNSSIDSDADTVPDSRDKCPNTPFGTGVDIYGCPIIKDEVIEPVVVEPTKPKRVIAPKDSDKDGIEDRLDHCPNTPKGLTVNSSGCPLKKRLEVKFEPNSANVTFESKPSLAKFANYLKRYPKAHITITGYTDTSGDRVRNQLLSQQRADSVKRLLVSYGVKASRITAIGKGDLNPIAPNDTPEGRAENRRIEVEIR